VALVSITLRPRHAHTRVIHSHSHSRHTSVPPPPAAVLVLPYWRPQIETERAAAFAELRELADGLKFSQLDNALVIAPFDDVRWGASCEHPVSHNSESTWFHVNR
jgi:hypothetical protein